MVLGLVCVAIKNESSSTCIKIKTHGDMDVILIKEYVTKTLGLRLHLDPWNPG